MKSLTLRQIAVLQLVADMGNQKLVAREIGMSHGGVKKTLDTCRWKLQANNTPHAVAIAWGRGLIR